MIFLKYVQEIFVLRFTIVFPINNEYITNLKFNTHSLQIKMN